MAGTGRVIDLMSITGTGAVTGYGWRSGTLWDGLLSGVSAARFEPGYGTDPAAGGWVAPVPKGGDPAAGRYPVPRDRGWLPGLRAAEVHTAVCGDVRHWPAFAGAAHRGVRRSRFPAIAAVDPVSVVLGPGDR
ncbi:hypothetical protein [Nocardia sp. CA-290969]|uniref:hypothetical protein n=1 Tax=Nocardia sp. CA-290969 TaxID=3239986 RepID=UPI003D8F0A9D